jgi:hypothetical protein
MKNNIQKQQGTILVVSLVLLTILTLAGVSNMTSSTLDLKISTNSRASFNSFQAASSAISEAMGDSNLDYTDAAEQQLSGSYKYLTGKDSNGGDIYIQVKVEITQGEKVNIGTALNQAEYGQSLGGRSGSARFMYREIRVTASSGNSTSVQVQGIRKSL